MIVDMGCYVSVRGCKKWG